MPTFIELLTALACAFTFAAGVFAPIWLVRQWSRGASALLLAPALVIGVSAPFVMSRILDAVEPSALSCGVACALAIALFASAVALLNTLEARRETPAA